MHHPTCRLAAIDCGTNTIRLLVADAYRDDHGRPHLEPVRRRSQIVRLGQGVDRTGLLDPQALERTLEAVSVYAADCEELGVAEGGSSRRFVATSATRDAGNRDEFVAGVRARLGVEPQVVSGQEEARLSFAGSLLGADGAGGAGRAGSRAGQAGGAGTSGSPGRSERLVVDLGGGSTELVLGDSRPRAAISLDTGSVRVTERYLAQTATSQVVTSQAVTSQAVEQAQAHVRALLDQAAQVVDLSAPSQLVGLAGTITTITAHALGLEEFQPEAIDGACLSVERTLASCEAVLHSTSQERRTWGYLAPGRRDVIAAGALVWGEVVARVAQETAQAGRPLAGVTTSLHDILDGIALSLLPEPPALSATASPSPTTVPGEAEAGYQAPSGAQP